MPRPRAVASRSYTRSRTGTVNNHFSSRARTRSCLEAQIRDRSVLMCRGGTSTGTSRAKRTLSTGWAAIQVWRRAHGPSNSNEPKSLTHKEVSLAWLALFTSWRISASIAADSVYFRIRRTTFIATRSLVLEWQHSRTRPKVPTPTSFTTSSDRSAK